MYLLYSFLLTVGFVALLPKFILDAITSRKYVTGLRQRLGTLPAIPPSALPIIWLHCVSVGEAEAARPLVDALLKKFPSHQIVISTTTVTGQTVAQKSFGGKAAAVFYFPIDWVWVVRRVLRSLRPAAVLIMETELWPNLLLECSRQSIPVALVNGRISGKSFYRYKRINPFMRRMLNNLTLALMQSEEDATRIRDLGLKDDVIRVPGNLKFDSVESAEDDHLTTELQTRFGINERTPLIVSASTHAPEERIIVEAFKQIRSNKPKIPARLLIAPRHPERFDEVAAVLRDSGLSWCRKSANRSALDTSCEVILLDSIGELRAAYSIAAIAFVGGSITPHGGHNVLEPAAKGICVITGPNTQNFAAITKALLEKGGLVQMPPVSMADASRELAETLISLLSDEPRRRSIGERALAVRNQNRGATDRTVAALGRLLKGPDVNEAATDLSALRATTAE
jgi:3-deoxy-D-manno-octulosonic-acid transferase